MADHPLQPPEADSDAADERSCLLTAPTYRKALEWLAVLGAAGIVAWPRRHAWRGWEIVVKDRSDLAQALHEIYLYEDEARDWPPSWHALPDADSEIPLGSLFVGLALAMLFLIMGPYSPLNTWHQIGVGDAGLVLAGEWWRIVTPLTLHSDVGHVGGNAIGCIFLGGAVCSRLGDGIGWLLILLSGVFGNLLTDLFYQSGHLSVGASTAVFGAIGMLGALRLHEYLKRRGPITGRGIGVPILVVAAMFSFMGLSPGADIMAHMFGATVGVVIGLPAGWLVRWRQRRVPQLLGGFTAFAIIGIAWYVGFALT